MSEQREANENAFQLVFFVSPQVFEHPQLCFPG
jgi:hypothetical protein